MIILVDNIQILQVMSYKHIVHHNWHSATTMPPGDSSDKKIQWERSVETCNIHHVLLQTYQVHYNNASRMTHRLDTNVHKEEENSSRFDDRPTLTIVYHAYQTLVMYSSERLGFVSLMMSTVNVSHTYKCDRIQEHPWRIV